MNLEIKLPIKDRLLILDLLPQRGGLITMSTAKEMIELFNFSSEEMTELGFKKEANDSISWSKAKTVSYQLNELQIETLMDGVEQTSKLGKITPDTIELALTVKALFEELQEFKQKEKLRKNINQLEELETKKEA